MSELPKYVTHHEPRCSLTNLHKLYLINPTCFWIKYFLHIKLTIPLYVSENFWIYRHLSPNFFLYRYYKLLPQIIKVYVMYVSFGSSTLIKQGPKENVWTTWTPVCRQTLTLHTTSTPSPPLTQTPLNDDPALKKLHLIWIQKGKYDLFFLSRGEYILRIYSTVSITYPSRSPLLCSSLTVSISFYSFHNR